MEKLQSKRFKIFKLIKIIGSIISLILIGGSCYLIYVVEGLDEENIKYKNELGQLVLTNEKIMEDYNSINKDVTFLTNIDQELSSLKKEVFKNIVLLEERIKAKEVNIKIAYLTFDDGPYYTTYKFLDVLDKYKVKGTFFVIGQGKTSCYDRSGYDCTKLYNEEASRGHTMANHTYSHIIWGSKGVYASVNNFINQVKKQEENIKKYTGVTTNFIRFPGGSSTAKTSLRNKIIAELRNMGYGWVDWTASNGDGGDLRNSTDAWNNFKKTINSNIEVILFHDYSTITLSILPKCIEYLQDSNYLILPLSRDSIMVNK